MKSLFLFALAGCISAIACAAPVSAPEHTSTVDQTIVASIPGACENSGGRCVSLGPPSSTCPNGTIVEGLCPGPRPGTVGGNPNCCIPNDVAPAAKVQLGNPCEDQFGGTCVSLGPDQNVCPGGTVLRGLCPAPRPGTVGGNPNCCVH
jgi:hypothetical protein